MKRTVGLHPIATLVFTAVLAGSAWAATNILTNGGFENPNPFADWQTVSGVQLRSFPNSTALGQAPQVAEVSANGGLLVSKVFVPARSSVVLSLSGYISRSPELNTTNPTPVSGQNQAVIRVRSTDPYNVNRHVAFFIHSQERFGRVDDGTGTGAVGLKWRSFNVFFRVNGGNNTISIQGVPSANPQPAAGRGVLLDGLVLQVVSN
jgi:hypothetical protein